jgi:hypothetical protein
MLWGLVTLVVCLKWLAFAAVSLAVFYIAMLYLLQVEQLPCAHKRARTSVV